MAELKVSVRDESACPVVSAAGEIDVDSAPELRSRLEELAARGVGTLVIDLSGTVYIDSTGLGVLVAARKRAVQAGGELRLVCPEPSLRKVFEITGVWEYFSFHDSVSSALTGASNP